ncbi:MAG: flagellar biosynthetic protein FliQ [Phycisphaerae bacterium]
MMELSTALDLGREALLTALVIAGPILGVGILVGLSVSLLQTLTQLQDQTFSIVPKIVAMFGAAIFFVPWLANRLVEYAQAMFAGGFGGT